MADVLVPDDDVERQRHAPGVTAAPSAGNVRARRRLAPPRRRCSRRREASPARRRAARHRRASPRARCWPPAKRCDRILPPLAAVAAASPSGASSSGMWHVRHSAMSTSSSTRVARLPAKAERRHAPSSSCPARCAGFPVSGERNERWHVAAHGGRSQRRHRHAGLDAPRGSRGRRRAESEWATTRDVAPVAVGPRGFDPVANPARDAAMGARVVGSDVGAHGSVGDERDVVAPAAEAARLAPDVVPEAVDRRRDRWDC